MDDDECYYNTNSRTDDTNQSISINQISSLSLRLNIQLASLKINLSKEIDENMEKVFNEESKRKSNKGRCQHSLQKNREIDSTSFLPNHKLLHSIYKGNDSQIEHENECKLVQSVIDDQNCGLGLKQRSSVILICFQSFVWNLDVIHERIREESKVKQCEFKSKCFPAVLILLFPYQDNSSLDLNLIDHHERTRPK